MVGSPEFQILQKLDVLLGVAGRCGEALDRIADAQERMAKVMEDSAPTTVKRADVRLDGKERF